MEPIKVLLVDHEEVFREGLASLLQQQPHIRVVYQCASVKEAIGKSKEMAPDVILIDNKVKDFDAAADAGETAKLPLKTKIAVMARPDTGPGALNILRSGARACLAKNISSSDLVKSIELISSGRIIVSPVFAEDFLNEISTQVGSGKDNVQKADSILSTREMEIVKQIAEGATNKEIANKLIIAENTVKVHVKNILNKLELRNRQQLVAYAVLQDWVNITK